MKLFQINKIFKKNIWTIEEDTLLLNLTWNIRKKWKIISNSFKNKSAYQCKLRYKLINPNIKKSIWDMLEDKKIIKGVCIFKNNWNKISSKFLPNRTSNQIRERYINILDPNLKKDKFTFEEDRLIVNLYNKYGSKWREIKKYLPGRSGDMIKNRFNSSIKKKYYVLKNNSEVR